MEARRLGAGGPSITRLGMGMAAIGRPAYQTLGHGEDFPEGRSPEAMERHAHQVLDEAFEAGVRYFDTARSYGRGEAFLRAWLEGRGLGPGDLAVGSKWGYRYVGAWRLEAERHEVKDHSRAAFAEQLEESEALLGPWLSLYQVHSVTPESPALGDGALLDDLARLRDRGVRVGLTVSGARQAEVVLRALEVVRGGAPLFAAVQATWNLLDRSCGDALARAHAAGRTVIVKEPLANGRLTPRGAAGQGGPLAEVAARTGAGADAVALAAVLAQPWADVVLLGAATVGQLRSNLAALRLSLDEAATERLGALREGPEAYWAERSRQPWT
ncbi:aldo/keto reductase [Anaeromyxobacter paludicola]|uniref:Oxidoreductase n=1 Tax=Anaeromyxobacter paludicola TaxID=2918171 RepID=A0ABM7X7R2_9BACT|nr:aldo/keto reductase [Anaeromyxobacter paludicola]BDG07881.1 oxidoreductase [Anaeromyxobacter paludicola]